MKLHSDLSELALVGREIIKTVPSPEASATVHSTNWARSWHLSVTPVSFEQARARLWLWWPHTNRGDY